MKDDIKLISMLSRLHNFISNDNDVVALFFTNINSDFNLSLSTSWNKDTNTLNDFVTRILDNLSNNQKSTLIIYLTFY